MERPSSFSGQGKRLPRLHERRPGWRPERSISTRWTAVLAANEFANTQSTAKSGTAIATAFPAGQLGRHGSYQQWAFLRNGRH
jgi:hypothetical protein